MNVARRVRHGEAPYTLVFYEDESGEQPALAWMRGLTSTKRRVLGVALHEVLSHEGVDVCTSEFGKPLGDGLFEFRLRHDSQEILALKGRLKRAVASATGSEKVLLRVFFHPTVTSSSFCSGATTRVASPEGSAKRPRLQSPASASLSGSGGTLRVAL